MGQDRESIGVLSRASEQNLVGEMVKCVWLEESVCLVIEREIRRTSAVESYCIYRVHDFITGESYWVDEDDLEKL
jgi:hypothetical protein